MGPGREICIISFGTKTTKAVVEGLRCHFQDFYFNCFYFKIKPRKCLLINHINNNVSSGVDWIVAYFFPASWIHQNKEVCDYRLYVAAHWWWNVIIKEAAFKHLLRSCLGFIVILWQSKGYLMCDSGQSQFSFLCRYIWEIMII